MKLLIIDENYPHLDNLMGNVFVHVRAKEYAKKHQVRVVSFFRKQRCFNYEGIEIEMADSIKTIQQSIQEYNPDRILIHFYHSWMLEHIIKGSEVPVLIWVHGYEALGWYRRLFNFTLYSPVLLSYILKNTIQQFNFRKLIHYSNASEKVRFCFVSEWMRKITEVDTLSRIKNKVILPNPIDTDLFKFSQKHPDLRKKILLLRSFETRKYANDLSIAAIHILASKPYFQDLSFTIIGKGQLFRKLTRTLINYSNVTLKETAVRQILIPVLHKEHGIFLCPTRQDAQGVSMCEAMSSGLIPITSRNTAIPEFVTDQESGFLTSSPQQIAAAIEKIYYNPDLFTAISKKSSESIKNISGFQETIKNELNFIEYEHN